MLSAHGNDRKSINRTSDSQLNQSGPGPVIRPITENDFEHIMNIENACFPGELAYSRQQMRYLLFKANSATLVEVDGDRITGYVTALFRRNSQVAGIETIGVHPEARGRGTGKRLLTAAERRMAAKGVAKCRLEVSAGNEAAISMYRKAGYDINRVIPEYYIYEHHGTRKAYTMLKDLEPKE